MLWCRGGNARWRTQLLTSPSPCKPGQPGGLVRHIGSKIWRSRFREEQERHGITWNISASRSSRKRLKKLIVEHEAQHRNEIAGN